MAKKLAMVFGVVFVLIGLLGFFNNPVVGLFAVNAVHNIVHILLGIILIWGSKGDAAKVLKIIAIVYFLVAVLGFVLAPADGMLLGLVEVNTADNWLHLVLAIVLFLASMGGKPMMMSKPPSAPNMSA
jgi:hypothetical protein